MRRILGAVAIAAALALGAPALATVSSTASRNDLVADGSTTAYAFTFPCLDKTWVQVKLAGVVQSSGFTVTLNGNQTTSPGGTVTFLVAPSVSTAVRFQRVTPKLQGAHYGVGQAFPSATHEAALDRLTMQSQEVDRRVADAEATHATDTAAQAATNAAQIARDAGQDSTWTANVAALNGTSHAVTDTSSCLALGTTTPRTLTARFADAPTLLDYGAIPDDGLDDTDAFNRAGLSGRRVLVPPGTYNVKSGAMMITLFAGSHLYAADPAKTIIDFAGAGSTGVSKQAIQLDGEGATVEGIGIVVSAGDYRIVAKLAASHTRLIRSNIDAHPTTLIAQGYIIHVAVAGVQTGVEIDRLDVTYSGDATLGGHGYQLADGIQAANTFGLKVTNCYFHDITNGTPSKLSWVMYISNNCLAAYVDNNRIVNAQTSGIKQSEQSTPTTDYGRRATNNFVKGVRYTGLAVEGALGVYLGGNQVLDCDLPVYVNGINTQLVGGFVANVIAATPPTEVGQPMITIHATGTSLSGVHLGVKGVAIHGVYTDAAETSIDGLISNSTDPPPTAVRFVSGASASSMSGGHLDAPVTAAGAANVDIGADDVTVTGGYIGFGAASGNAFGVKITASNDKVVGAKIVGTGVSSLYGVYIPGGAVNAHVAEVSISGNTGAAISDAGTASVLRDYLVAGKPSRKCTVTSAIATGATVTHGLGATPTSVTLTATDATPTAVYPSALGGTTFTVNYAGGGTHTFYWCASAE